MEQNWRDLLFIHWSVDPAEIQKTLPRGLVVDTFDGKAYLGIVPFKIKECRLEFFPVIKVDFLEVNFRTYVKDSEGKEGIWFYALYANLSPAVLLARLGYFLPYIYSSIKCQMNICEISYALFRKEKDYYNFSYKSGAYIAPLKTLDHFLIERYVLFSSKREQLFTAQVFHESYPITPAKKIDLQTQLIKPFKSAQFEPSACFFSLGVDVEIGLLKKN